MISIDGLNPGYYDFPALAALRKEGSSAQGVVGQYPSLTYPAHTSIVTGTRPATHGIASNTIFDPLHGSKLWYSKSAAIRVPTLWDIAKSAGMTTAAVAWPVTVGAPIDFLIPEAYPPPAGMTTQQYTRSVSTPGLLAAIGGSVNPDDPAERDEFFTRAAVYILKTYRPNLLLLHLTNTDSVQHTYGRSGPEVSRVFMKAAAEVAEIVKALEDAGIRRQTTIVVTGDHGFQNVHSYLQPNVLLREAGLLQTDAEGNITSWKAAAHAAAIRLADPKDKKTADRVTELFRKASRQGPYQGLFRLVEQRELRALGAYPEALFVVEPVAGYLPVETFQSDRFVVPAPIQGAHGFLPDTPMMRTGLIMFGRGVRAGVSSPVVRQIDIAPTIARLLGLSLKSSEGVALTRWLN